MKVENNMDVNDLVKTTSLRRKATLNVTFCVKKERNASFKKVSRILQKAEGDRTEEEKEVLVSCAEVVQEVTTRLEKRKVLKARSEEVEDSREVLERKCETLARAVRSARHLVVYSGAGVSTAACIPDYRGANGIWTRLQQGLDIGEHDLSKSQPTVTHMVLYALYRRGVIKHVVSQNCDGLHLRSGLPRASLSEVHGNMYLEVCQPCKQEYWRLFDVTEHTGRYTHATARRCYKCHSPLRDTIVHFGERGALRWPINWTGATAAANQADVILCIGSSLKVLKKYTWLWGMDRPVKKRPNLYIVNLQWTPKDEQAALKINGKCDEVMSLVMSKLNIPIPDYDPELDPIFAHATRLHAVETHTHSTAELRWPAALQGREEEKRPSDAAEEESEHRKKVCEEVSKPTVKTEENEKATDKEGKDEKPSVNDSASESSLADTTDVKVDGKDKVEKADGEANVDNQNSCVHVKTEPADGEVSNEIKEEPKPDVQKSPTKGIWRPFSFEDVENSPSSSGVAQFVEVKTEPLQNANTSQFSSSLALKPDLCFSKPDLLLDRNVKKCSMQSEPLDLSCARKSETEREKENPYFCKYCRVHYHSGFCLFYRKQCSDSPPDPPCYCCDEEEEKDPLSPENDGKSGTDESEKTAAKVPITNPGWFGKGCRKKIRKKR